MAPVGSALVTNPSDTFQTGAFVRNCIYTLVFMDRSGSADKNTRLFVCFLFSSHDPVWGAYLFPWGGRCLSAAFNEEPWNELKHCWLTRITREVPVSYPSRTPERTTQPTLDYQQGGDFSRNEGRLQENDASEALKQSCIPSALAWGSAWFPV